MSWTIEDLLEQVRSPSESPAPAANRGRIGVLGLARNGDSLVVEVAVGSADDQRWRLDFRAMWTDVRRLPLDAAALVVRSDVEEWWDMGAEEDRPGGFVRARRIT